MNRRLNFGCGANILPPPWENYDADVPIDKPLPFPDGCAQFIFAEHVCEHITPTEFWNFIGECYRIMQPKGVIRIAVPDITKIWNKMTDEYLSWLKNQGFTDGSSAGAIKNIVVNHGHKSLWTLGLLGTILLASGFYGVIPCKPGNSINPFLKGIEGHDKIIGEQNNLIETLCVEAVKP